MSAARRERGAVRPSRFRPAHAVALLVLLLVAVAGFFVVRAVMQGHESSTPSAAPATAERLRSLVPDRIIDAFSGTPGPQGGPPGEPRLPAAGAIESTTGGSDAVGLPPEPALAGLSVQTRDTLRLRYNLGLLRWHQGDTDGALAAFRSVLEIDPQGQYGSRAFLQMGLIHFARRAYDAAAADFRKAVALDGNDPLAAHNLGLALLHAGKTPEAVAELSRAARLDGANAGILMNLGNAHLAAGQAGPAAAAYRGAIQIEPARADARFNLGLTLYRTQDYEGAQREFTAAAAALRGEPQARAHAWLGMAAYQRGFFDEAAKAFGRAAASAPGAVNYRFNEAVALARSGLRGEAARAYEAALSASARDAAAWFGLAGVLFLDGKASEALTAYNRGLAIDTTATAALFTSGFILYERGEMAEAVRRFERVIELRGPESARAQVNLGLCLEAQGKLEEAAAAYAKGDQEDPRTFYNLGLVRRRLLNHAGAVEAFQRAVLLKPTSSLYQSALGDAYLEAGRPDAALAAYQKALTAAGQEDFDLLLRISALATRLERSGEAEGFVRRSVQAARTGPEKARAFLAEGVLFDRKGDMAAALTSFRRAASEDRTNPDVYYNLGVVLARVQSWDEAVDALRTSIRLRSANAPAWTQLGNIFAARGLRDEAAQAYLQAVRIDSSTVEATFNLQELGAGR